MLEQVRIKRAVIHVSDDNFANGYQAGYLRYALDFRNKPLTDAELYSFLANHTLDVFNASVANAGYIAGFFAALYGCPPLPIEQRANVAIVEA
jgi:hypothetical protein